MIDLELDTTTHDLKITNGDLVLTTAEKQVEQNVKIRLLFFYGEWFLDTSVGIDFFGQIFVQNPDPVLIDNLIKATIIDTPDIDELVEYKSTLNRGLRRFTIDNFKARSRFGTVTLQNLELLP